MVLKQEEKDYLRIINHDYKKAIELDKYLSTHFNSPNEIKKFEDQQKKLTEKIFKDKFKKLK